MKQKINFSDSTLHSLNHAFMLYFPKEAARQIENMPPENAKNILIDQPIKILHPLWENFVPGIAQNLFQYLPIKTKINLLKHIDLGNAAELLRQCGREEKEKIFSLLDEYFVKELKEYLAYPVDSIGSIMDSHIMSFNKDIIVKDALTQLRNFKIKDIYQLFLLDQDMCLWGQIDINQLVLADDKQILSSLSVPVKVYVTAMESKDDVISIMNKFNLNSIPVINEKKQLLGIVDRNHIFEEFKEDLATDFQTMVGVSKDEKALSSAWFAVKKRQPWLQINLLTAFLAAAVVGLFEETIAKYTALAILLPIAAGQSGNTGAQSLAVTMRGLTLREVTVKDWIQLIIKESCASIINGLAIAFTCGIGVYFWSRSYGLSLIIALAMISSMTIAAISGALIPLILKRLGQDPALSSSIILTTVTDIAGFMSFLGIATLLSSLL